MKIEELRAAFEAATKPVTPLRCDFGTHEFIAAWRLPFWMWETTRVFQDDELVRVEVSRIKVIEYGVAPGASVPTILCIDKDGVRVRGSVEMYHTTEESARAEADYTMAYKALSRARERFQVLAYECFPALLECAEALEAILDCANVRIDDLRIHKFDAARTALAALEELK